MELADSPEEAAFRAEARAFLADHAELKADDGGIDHGLLGDTDPETEAEHVRRAKAWQATLYDAGWAGITWPTEHGGRGGTPMQQVIFNQEQARFRVPSSIFAQGIGMAGPTLIGHGTSTQRTRFLGPMLRGDEVWCQLFSEPGAGSDLAGLSTKAELDGDEFVVNGQKVWTSSAQFSDWAILLARTNRSAPKHKGITYFLVDMRTPGIDVRPLRQITGVAHFNEVFLTDVRIPVENVVGPVDDGWMVTITTLANERTHISSGMGGRDVVAELTRLARQRGLEGDPVVRQRLADVYAHQQVIRYLGLRVQTAISHGGVPGPESSVLKLAHSTQLARVGDLGVNLTGADGMVLDYAHLDGGPFQTSFLSQWAGRIGGGTEQVQRNVMGERLLGLPREPKPS